MHSLWVIWVFRFSTSNYDSAFCCCCSLLEHYRAPQFPHHLFVFCSLPCGSLFLLQHLVPLFTCIVQNYRSRQFQFCLAHYLACDSFLSIIWCILFIEATVGSRKTTPNCFNCEVVRCQKLIQFTLQGIKSLFKWVNPIYTMAVSRALIWYTNITSPHTIV